MDLSSKAMLLMLLALLLVGSARGLRILAFGDVLQQNYGAGFDSLWSHDFYATPLQEILRHEVDEFAEVHPLGFENHFMLEPSKLAQSRLMKNWAGYNPLMPERLELELGRSTAEDPAPYDWVLIYAGNPELVDNNIAPTIYNRLEDMYEMTLSQGYKVMGMTLVPYSQGTIAAPRLSGERKKLNQLIRQYVARKRVEGQDRFFLTDFERSMLGGSTTGNSSKRMHVWDSAARGLTGQGHILMAQMLYQTLDFDFNENATWGLV